jgi:hypothetical protein
MHSRAVEIRRAVLACFRSHGRYLAAKNSRVPRRIREGDADTAPTAISRCTGPSRPFRACRRGMFGQPALSMQISELENELEAKLVERQHGATVKVRRAAHHWQTEARFLA